MKLGKIRKWISGFTKIALIDKAGTFIEYSLGGEGNQEPLDNEEILVISHHENCIAIMLDVLDDELVFVDTAEGYMARRK